MYINRKCYYTASILAIVIGVPGPEFSSIDAMYELLENWGGLSLRS